MNRGGAAVATWIFRGRRVTAAPRLRRENSVETGARIRYLDGGDSCLALQTFTGNHGVEMSPKTYATAWKSLSRRD